MANSILDIEDTMLEATARFERWKKSFIKDLYGPIGEMALQLLWLSLDQAGREEIRKINPDAVMRFEEQLFRKKS